jgi:hypothetical protein
MHVSKIIRLVAIGSALATGGAILMLLPSASAADKTPDEITAICDKSSKINGVQQEATGLADGFRADTCDFVEKDMVPFDGPKEKASIDFPNCEPNAPKPASVSVTWSASAAQGQGKYTVTTEGFGGNLFGILNVGWTRHTGTLDMTTKTATAGDTETREVPVGKVLTFEFTPKMQRMTGVWKVFTAARAATTTTNASPEVNLEAEEVVEGPVVLPSVAGAPGRLDGTITPVFTDC